MEINLKEISDVETAWSEEIKRRLAEIDAGTVELISWDEVRTEFLAHLDDGKDSILVSHKKAHKAQRLN